jgi:hypothetical protein
LDEEEMYPADPFCNVCRDGGNLMLCDVCDKSYHAACVQLESVPAGTWTCPYHQCATCFEGVDRNLPSLSCSMCPTSYCSAHIPSDLRARSETIGCHEIMCGECLKKEEEYEFIHRSKGASENSCRRAFLHRLQMVLKREGSQLTRLPILGGRELDLYQLYTQVCKGGGIYTILDSVGWKDIRRALRLPPTVRHQSALLKKFYLQILYPYEKQFFPFFTQLPLKKALAENADDEEEEELSLLAAAASVPGKKKAAAKSAAQQLVDEYASSSSARAEPGQKDDTAPSDVLVSLKVGLPGGHASMKAKETTAARGKKKQKEKEKEKKRAREKEKERGSKRQREKKASAKNQRASKRGATVGRNTSVPLSAAAAAAQLGLTAPLKEHPAINIWTPTWWAHQANSGASALRHASASSTAAGGAGAQVSHSVADINAALAAAMAAASESPSLRPLASATVVGSFEQMESMDYVATPSLVALPPMPALATLPNLPALPVPTMPLAPPALHTDSSSSKRKYQEILLAAQAAAMPSMVSAAVSVSVSVSSCALSSAAAVSVDAPAAHSIALPLTPPEKRGRGRPPKVLTPVQSTNGHADATAPSATEDVDMSSSDADAGSSGEAHMSKRRKTSNGPSLQQ